MNTIRSLFVFDIETVPCMESSRALLGLSTDVPDEDVAQKLTEYHLEITKGQNEFYRQPFHKVACVSFMTCNITTVHGGQEKFEIKSIKTGGRRGESEESIIRALFDYLAKTPSRLVSFNGRTFDLPVLQYRAMKYGIDARWIYDTPGGKFDNNYNHRFSMEKHCDLVEAFSNFGASARVKMAELCALMGVPCKVEGSGDKVYPMYRAGKIEEICNYCETDVICTYILYLKYMHHCGKLSAERYNSAIDDLLFRLKDPAAPEYLKRFAGDFSVAQGERLHV